MTSSQPLADLILRPLREAAPGSYSQLNAADQFDLDVARARSPCERLVAFDQIQLLVERLGMPKPSREPIRHHDIRL